MNYQGTFITVAPDCPADHGVVPTAKGASRSVHFIQYELLTEHPYAFTGQELIFETHVRRLGLSEAEVAVRRDEVDERAVDKAPVLGYRGNKPDLMIQRYPASGGKNPSVKIGILDVSSKKTTWVKLPDDKDRYVGRFAWTPSGSSLFFQSLDRDQQHLTLYRVDPKSGAATAVTVEASPAWIELSDMRLFEKSDALLWTAVRGGHTHLETRDRTTGKVIAQITDGPWDVTAIQAVDEERGVVYFKTLPFVDGSRVGIYGYSYGGFMAALAMFKAPEVFKVGVSGAPVTDWQFYDSGCTERFMGTREANPAGYEATDLTRMVKGLQGHLLLMHGLMDENVHFQNSAALIDALIAENKLFDLFVFPGERHGYRSPAARKFANRKVVSYLVDHL